MLFATYSKTCSVFPWRDKQLPWTGLLHASPHFYSSVCLHKRIAGHRQHPHADRWFTSSWGTSQVSKSTSTCVLWSMEVITNPSSFHGHMTRQQVDLRCLIKQTYVSFPSQVYTRLHFISSDPGAEISDMWRLWVCVCPERLPALPHVSCMCRDPAQAELGGGALHHSISHYEVSVGV